jgi:hypothetical protein
VFSKQNKEFNETDKAGEFFFEKRIQVHAQVPVSPRAKNLGSSDSMQLGFHW